MKDEEKQILVYDTTLRDGCQAQDVALTVEDKLEVAHWLDELGLHYIEGGYAGSNPKEDQFFREARRLNLKHARLAAFGSTRRK
ncbi:MAG: citramalate synthase, partial [Planctomycetota bacterium]